MPDVAHHRTILKRLLPEVVLPGAIYFSVSPFAPVLVALAAASSVPLIETIVRLARGKKPTLVGLVLLAVLGTSAGLAALFDSHLFILARGAVISAALGTAFAVSAVCRRPLTRWLAVHLSTDHAEARVRLRERWRTPVALKVFRTLSVGWGLLLLASAAQQAAVVLTLSPGAVMALEPPIQAIATGLGIAASIAYARRSQRAHPELGLLPARAK